MIRLALFMMALAIPFAPAHASYWIVCTVEASIEGKNKTPDGYSITVKSAEVIDGHHEPGEACPEMKDKIGKSIDIVSKDALPVGEDATLEYNYYDAMTANGILVEESWSLKPSLLEKIL